MLQNKRYIGTRIKAAREAKEISQAKLARVVHRTRSLVNMWEAGKATPSVEHLSQIADFLGVGLEWLASGQGSPNFGRPLPSVPSEDVPMSTALVLEHIMRELAHIRREIKELRAEMANKPRSA